MEKKGNIFIIAIIVLVVLIGGFFVFKGGFNSSSNSGEGIVAVEKSDIQEEPTSNEENIQKEIPTPKTQETKEFNVIAKQWDFSPSTITVNEGDRVILNIKSIDVNHGFALSTFGISEFLSPGNTVKLEFVADKTGTFSFFCNVSCGVGHSRMRGKLVVQ